MVFEKFKTLVLASKLNFSTEKKHHIHNRRIKLRLVMYLDMSVWKKVDKLLYSVADRQRAIVTPKNIICCIYLWIFILK